MSEDWQRDVAVVLAAHGDRAGDRPNATLLAHRDSIAVSSAFRCVTAGVLKGDLDLEAAIAEGIDSGATHLAVYPFFMSDGYFVGQVLPQRIADMGATEKCRLLVPFGLDPELPPLLHSQAATAAKAAGIAPSMARHLIVGHGSELGPASANATRRAAEHSARLGGFARTETAFLEEPPFIDDALADGAGQTVVSGFFSGDGLHAGIDVPEAIRLSKSEAVYAGPIGASPAIPSLIARSVAAAMRQR